MYRLAGLVLCFSLLTPAIAIDAPVEKVIDLRIEGELCLENLQQNAPMAAQYDTPDDEDNAFRNAGFEYRRRSEALVQRLANSNNAEEHLFRAHLLMAEPLLAAESLNRAFEIDPGNLLILRKLASFCLNHDQPFCAEVADRLAQSPQSTANELVLAAELYNRSGHAGIETLYEKSVQRGFSNRFGEDLDYAWRMVKTELEFSNLEAYGVSKSSLAVAFTFASTSSYYWFGMSTACDPQQEDRPYSIDPSICLDLAQSLAEQATEVISRSVAAGLLLRMAEHSGNPEQLAQAQLLKQSEDDFQNRSIGLSCYDEGRFQKHFLDVEYLLSVIKIGELATVSALIEQAENGELE